MPRRKLSVDSRVSRRIRWSHIGLLCVVLLIASDLLIDNVADFWARHALFAGLISGALMLLITVLIVDDVLAEREARRSMFIQRSLGQALAQQAHRVLREANEALLSAYRDREEAIGATQAHRLQAEEDARRGRTLRQRWQILKRSYDNLFSFGGLYGEMGNVILEGLRKESEVARERQRAREIVHASAAQFETGLAVAVPSLSSTQQGRECLEAGYTFLKILYEVTEEAGTMRPAAEALAGSSIVQALEGFEERVKLLGGGSVSGM